MATPTFYHSDLTETCTSIELTASEAQHARAARRLGEGQRVKILNGAGLVGIGQIAVLQRHTVVVSINSITSAERQDGHITICAGVPKGDRQRVMVESLTQLGIRQIVPIRCEFSATALNLKALEKWHRYGIEAIKQSQNPWLPAIIEETPLIDVCHSRQNECRWVADASGDYFVRLLGSSQLEEFGHSGKRHSVFIGPEGGFSESERKLLIDSGCKAVKLADAILRTETAAVAAAAQLSPLLEST